MAKHKFNIPEFVELFEGVRGDPTKHLNGKSDDGEYLVPDSDIAEFAKAVLASEFYCEGWLVGCEPRTVLFEDVIRDLASDNPKRVRAAVNKAYGAEHRIHFMGLEAYVEWRKAGMPTESKVKPKTASQDTPKPASDKKKPAPKPNALPGSILRKGTREKLESLLARQSLIEQMPEDVRHNLLGAGGALRKGQLTEYTARAVVVMVEQWLKVRKAQRDHAAYVAGLEGLGIVLMQQVDNLLQMFGEDPEVIEHVFCRLAGAISDPKELARAIKAGDKLAGLRDGSIAPVVQMQSEPDVTNIADADYVRARLGHFMVPERGRPVAGAGKGQKEKSRKSG